MIELESAAENESEKRTVLSPRIVFMQLFHVDLCGRRRTTTTTRELLRRRRRSRRCLAARFAFFNIILHLKSVIL